MTFVLVSSLSRDTRSTTHGSLLDCVITLQDIFSESSVTAMTVGMMETSGTYLK